MYLLIEASTSFLHNLCAMSIVIPWKEKQRERDRVRRNEYRETQRKSEREKERERK